ncbi:hypothetical protein [Enterococcus sp. LJL90]
MTNPLLDNYYVDVSDKRTVGLTILVLLHELRVLTSEQILNLLSLTGKSSFPAVSRWTTYLEKQQFISSLKIQERNNEKCYYLTKEGNRYIGGLYGYPRNPDYNLNHHLLLTDCLYTSMTIAQESPFFHSVLTERRQAYEKKETENKKGNTYTVADYIFSFLTKEENEIRHYFEVELTFKSKNRYLKGIFPKYYHYLDQGIHQHDYLFYITPNEYILGELRAMKSYFFSQEDRKEKVANRFQIVHLDEFPASYRTLVMQSAVLQER